MYKNLVSETAGQIFMVFLYEYLVGLRIGTFFCIYMAKRLPGQLVVMGLWKRLWTIFFVFKNSIYTDNLKSTPVLPKVPYYPVTGL